MWKIFLSQIKYKSFLNCIHSAKKVFFDHKKYIKNFVVNSTIWSLKFWKHSICGIP